jgi:murein DD-endopeptidase MepM/ murein hydrolase activator NlpD
MLRTTPIALLCALAILGQVRGQEVMIARPAKALPSKAESVKQLPAEHAAKAQPGVTPTDKPQSAIVQITKATEPRILKAQPVVPGIAKGFSAVSQVTKDQAPTVLKTQPVVAPSVKTGSSVARGTKEQAPLILKAQPVVPPITKTASLIAKGSTAPTEQPVFSSAEQPQSSVVQPLKRQAPAPVKTPPIIAASPKAPSSVSPQSQEQPTAAQPVNGQMEMAFTKLADGFDFPVGKPEAQGYYKARGFRSHGHLGEDWDGVGGGDTDLGDPIYSIGDGIVVFARDVHMGWGKVVIVRHSYRENGTVKTIDALYGHLNSILVSRGHNVARGQQIATMGTAHGQYDAHLHLEIRKNIEIGMSRSAFQRDFTNYYDPSAFITAHRRLSAGGSKYRVALNTFAHDSAYHFDTAHNFSARPRSNAESAAALKRAVANGGH